MEPILFYGAPGGCSLGAIVALEWSGIPYKLCRIPLGDPVTSEQYRKSVLLGQTPTLRVGDRLIGQSIAVLKHIAAQSNDPRMGAKEGIEADRLNMILGFLHTSFFGAFSPLWIAMHGASEKDKESLIKMGKERVFIAHEQLEMLLDGREWLAGNGPTIADAYFMGLVRWNDIHNAIDQSSFHNIIGLKNRLAELPAFSFAYAVENELIAKSAGQFNGFVSLDVALNDIKGYV